jgi:hypothetical protein
MIYSFFPSSLVRDVLTVLNLMYYELLIFLLSLLDVIYDSNIALDVIIFLRFCKLARQQL